MTVDGVHVGDVFGVRIRAGHSFLIALAFAAMWMLRANSTPELAARLALAATLVVSVLAHELAHAKTASALGVPVRHVVLTWFGGFAQFWVEPKRGWREIAIAAAGPAANLAIAGLAFVAIWLLQAKFSLASAPLTISNLGEPQSIPAMLQTAVWMNLVMACFNLMPGLPLDGGHILRSVLSWRMSPGRAEWIAAWGGVAVGLAAAVLAIAARELTLFIAGLFVISVAWSEKESMRSD